MAECPASLCILCTRFKKNEQSVNWCLHCEGGICSACSCEHQSSNDFKNHTLIPVVDSGKLSPFANLKLICHEHKLQTEFYCRKHRSELCSECLSFHKGCEIICTFENSKENFKELEALLLDINGNIDKLKQFVQENLTGLEKQREQLQKEIRQVRNKVIASLNELEASINKELIETESTAQRIITETLASLEKTKEQASKCESDLTIIRHYANNLSDYKLFLSKKQVENCAFDLEQFIHTYITENNLNNLSLNLNLNESILNISYIDYFGKIHIDKGRAQLIDDVLREIGQNRIRRKGNEGRSIDYIQPTLIERVDTRCYEIKSCALLPNGKMILSRLQYPAKLTMLKSNGSFDNEFEKMSYGISPINDNTIALSTGGFGIHIFDVADKKVVRNYACSSYGGVAATDTSYVYCSGKKKIEMIDKEDYSVSSVCSYRGKEFPYIAVFNNNIYLTNKSSHSVVCCDIRGGIIWTFKDASALTEPRGITIDSSGNVYVTDSLLSRVIVISPDGERYLVLLNREDGVNEAWGICCDREANTLLVANKMGTVLLFRLD